MFSLNVKFFMGIRKPFSNFSGPPLLLQTPAPHLISAPNSLSTGYCAWGPTLTWYDRKNKLLGASTSEHMGLPGESLLRWYWSRPLSGTGIKLLLIEPIFKIHLKCYAICFLECGMPVMICKKFKTWKIERQNWFESGPGIDDDKIEYIHIRPFSLHTDFAEGRLLRDSKWGDREIFLKMQTFLICSQSLENHSVMPLSHSPGFSRSAEN